MMGQHGGDQNRLLYSFNLDDHIPPDHLLRGIDRFLDLRVQQGTYPEVSPQVFLN